MQDVNSENKKIQEIETLLSDEPKIATERAVALRNEYPNSENTALLLARCYRANKQYDEAQPILEQLIKSPTVKIIARMELATVLNKKQQTKEAIALLQETTQLAPEYHEVWEILSQHLYNAGRLDEAKNTLNQFHMIKEFNVQLANAIDHFDGERFEESEALCKKLLEQVPTEVRVLKLLAKLSYRSGQPQISASILEYCILQKPTDIAIGLDYVKSLLAANEYQKSIIECQRILQMDSENLQIKSALAEGQVKTGNYAGALESYANMFEHHPRKDLCLLRKGNVLKIIGQTEQAVASFKKAIELNPNLGEAYWDLANLKTFTFNESDIQEMKSQLEGDNLSSEDRVFFNFSMGKAMEDQESFSESFSFYKIANDSRSQNITDKAMNELEAIKPFFTKHYFEQLSASGHPSKEPIFIVGLRRSGSTLLEQILASHSKIEGTTEFMGIPSIVQSLSISTAGEFTYYTEQLKELDSVKKNALGQSYLDAIKTFRTNSPHFIDKLPNNFQYIGLIKTIFPNAKIIDIRRNPMACGWSLYRQNFADGMSYSYDLAAIGQYYNEYVAIMDHWNDVLPNQILSLKYEDLVNDFDNKVKEILSYCGLEFEDNCLSFYDNNRPVSTISSEQVRTPIYSNAIEHWKNFENYLTPLKQALEQ